MVTANLIFTQAAIPGTPGWAYEGAAGGLVTLSNFDNTDVTEWLYELLSTPYNSGLAVGVLSSGAAPTATFMPDVSGCYRTLLYTKDSSNNGASQIRVFGVPNARGWIVPAFDGIAAEHNFNGQVRGWAGDNSVVMLDSILDDIAANLGGGATSATDFYGLTLDAVPTELFVNGAPGTRKSVPNNGTMIAEILLTAKIAGGGAVNAWRLTAVYRNSAGVATLVNYVKEMFTNETVGLDVALGTSGGNMSLVVTGIAANIAWKAHMVYSNNDLPAI